MKLKFVCVSVKALRYVSWIHWLGPSKTKTNRSDIVTSWIRKVCVFLKWERKEEVWSQSFFSLIGAMISHALIKNPNVIVIRKVLERAWVADVQVRRALSKKYFWRSALNPECCYNAPDHFPKLFELNFNIIFLVLNFKYIFDI